MNELNELKKYEYFRTEHGVLYHGDCQDILPLLAEQEADLVLTDPPYFKIKADEWDRQWSTLDDYIAWLGGVASMLKQRMKQSGSLYIFADDHRVAYVQVELDKMFTFLNHPIWYKRNNMPQKFAHNQRRYCPMSERILFYSIQDQTGLQMIHSMEDCFKPIKGYMRSQKERIKKDYGFRTEKEFNDFINDWTDTRSVVSRHYFADSQYTFPTEEIYHKLQKIPNPNNTEQEYFRKEYEYFRKEYEDLRRVWHYQNGIHEIIDIPIITETENTAHPTTKPRQLIELLVKASSNPGDLVIDPFLGSGTTAVVCERLRRRWIGIEISEEYCQLSKERIQNEANNRRLDEWMI